MLSYLRKSDGLTVALLTASCYVAAYFFEVGYARHVGIPVEIISISLGNIVSTSIFLFFATVIAFFACTFPYIIIARNFGKHKIAVLSSFVLSLVIFALLNIYLLGELTKGIIIKAICSWLFLTFVFYLLINDGNKTVDSEKPKPLFNKIYDITGLIFWLFFPCAFFIMNCGIYSATQQTSFDTFVLKKDEYAILRIYGDNIVTKKIINKKMSNGIYIFKTDDFKEVQILTKSNNK